MEEHTHLEPLNKDEWEEHTNLEPLDEDGWKNILTLNLLMRMDGRTYSP